MQVPVPGATVGGGSGTISLQFTTAQNAAMATSLLNAIYVAAQTNSQTSGLNVQTDYPTTAPSGSDFYNEFVVGDLNGQNTGSTQAIVPSGYNVIINAFTSQPATITGPVGNEVETVLSGEGGLTYYLNGGSGTVMAGGGNNLIAAGDDTPLSGAGWTLLFDGGNNTVDAGIGDYFIDDGSSGSAGSNVLFLGSGTETVESYGTDVIVAAPGGTATITTYHAGTVVYGNNGQTALVNLGGSDSFVAGGGTDTVYADAGGGLYFGSSGPLTFVGAAYANSTVVAGAGPAMLFAGAGASDVFYVGAGQFLLAAGSGSQVVVGSTAVSGPVSGAVMFAGNGGAITLLGNTNNNALIAGSGNVTLNAAGATGSNIMYAGTGSDCMVAGAGTSWIVPGPGSDTVGGGSGVAVLEVDQAYAGGGNELVYNWSGNDQLALFGYGGAGSNGLPGGASMAVVNGSEVLTLPDGTRITFAGTGQVNPAQIHSA